MLRTCNALRIASLPVLRKDGARRRYVGLDEGTGLGLLRAARNDGAPFRRPPRPPVQPNVSDI
ncbi:MAG: hypothetical protein LBM98_01345 [Oscillospiraceae bacterium]|nr:hypothetical protein [Oscillospiraceae bacterium]